MRGKLAKSKAWAIIRTNYDPPDRAQLIEDAKAGIGYVPPAEFEAR